MAQNFDAASVQDELVQSVKQGEEDRARVLVSQLGTTPKQVRAVLEAMLEAPDSLVRQAAAFGLGELGGKASALRLERQLTLEEQRGDYDGSAVVEDITRALGRIAETSARAALVRRLERLVAGKHERSDVNELALSLWRQRHPDLIPAVRRSLETISLPEPHSMHGLLVLLEKSPADLDAWARDPAVPIKHKTRVVVLLEEELPATLISVVPVFIATAETLSEQTMRQESEAEHYCERLLSLLLTHRERLLTSLPEQTRSALRTISRRLIAATFPNPSVSAAVVLETIGRPEDAPFLEEHCPEYPTLAKVFRDAAQTLRNLH